MASLPDQRRSSNAFSSMATMANHRRRPSNPYQKGGRSRGFFLLVSLGILVGVVVFCSIAMVSLGTQDPSDTGSQDGKREGQPKLRASGASALQDEKKKPNTNSESDNPESFDIIDPVDHGVKHQERLVLQQEILHDEPKETAKPEVVVVKAMDNYDFDPIMMFHHYSPGKSGYVIEDMFMAHAYAFHMNSIYGGACRKNENVNVQKHERVLEAIGLKDAMPFSCPKDHRSNRLVQKRTIPHEEYHRDGTRIWTPEYVAYLQSLIEYPKKADDQYVIVVHVRRGDVTPCRAKHEGYDRYLPNLHYLILIELYQKPGARVVIISDSDAFESLEEFRERGYEIRLDQDLPDMWRAFATADVLILSRSEFTLIPAVCAMGRVVYTPFWHPPVRNWDRVPKEIMKETDAEMKRLQAERCNTGG